ncbi:MAG: ABC transporter permease, partial [Bacillota bacterium]
GAHLSLGYVTMFSEDMTGGRGFVAYTGVVFGRANPWLVSIASLLFGVAEALTFRVQRLGVPPALILMLPYIATVCALLVRMRIEQRKGAPRITLKPRDESA